MPVINARTKEINAKVVFYGPGHSGKTTNIKKIFSILKPSVRGKLMALSTQSDRTIFFDYLPVDLGNVRGMTMKIQLYTVPGQVFYNSTRRLVLKNVDGVVFVADSSRKSLPDNLESLANLQENMALNGLSLDTVPWVIQYNKRDAEDALSVSKLSEKINRWGVPEYEAIADKGEGVMTTLTGITKLVVRKLSQAQTDTPIAKVSNTSEISDRANEPRSKNTDLPSVDIATPKISVPEDPPQQTPMVANAPLNPPTPSPSEIDKMLDNPVEKDLDLVASKANTTVDDEDIEIDDSELLEEIEPDEEISLKIASKPTWDNGTLVVPITITIDQTEMVRELRITLDPTDTDLD